MAGRARGPTRGPGPSLLPMGLPGLVSVRGEDGSGGVGRHMAIWRAVATRRSSASHTSASSSRYPPTSTVVRSHRRNQPGAGRAWTWTVSSTVGTQPRTPRS